MSKFYKRKSDGKEYKKYEEISNGIILTAFDEKTGQSIVNSGYKLCVTKEQLKEEFEVFEFKLQTSDRINSLVTKYLKDIVYQLQNHGIMEEQLQRLDEFIGCSSETCSFYNDIVNFDKYDVEKLVNKLDDQDFYYEEFEEIVPFIQNALVPAMKKMLIEFEEGKDD